MNKVAIVLFADPNQKEGYARALHGLIYAKELSGKGKAVKLLFEGAGVMIIEKVGGKDAKLSEIFAELNIGVYSPGKVYAGACRACAESFGANAEDAKKAGFELLGEDHSHPDIAGLIDDGFALLAL